MKAKAAARWVAVACTVALLGVAVHQAFAPGEGSTLHGVIVASATVLWALLQRKKPVWALALAGAGGFFCAGGWLVGGRPPGGVSAQVLVMVVSLAQILSIVVLARVERELKSARA